VPLTRLTFRALVGEAAALRRRLEVLEAVLDHRNTGLDLRPNDLLALYSQIVTAAEQGVDRTLQRDLALLLVRVRARDLASLARLTRDPNSWRPLILLAIRLCHEADDEVTRRIAVVALDQLEKMVNAALERRVGRRAIARYADQVGGKPTRQHVYRLRVIQRRYRHDLAARMRPKVLAR
jgi:hypothetical protein